VICSKNWVPRPGFKLHYPVPNRGWIPAFFTDYANETLLAVGCGVGSRLEFLDIFGSRAKTYGVAFTDVYRFDILQTHNGLFI